MIGQQMEKLTKTEAMEVLVRNKAQAPNKWQRPVPGYYYVCVSCFSSEFYLGSKTVADRAAYRVGWRESPIGYFCLCCLHPEACEEVEELE